MPLSHPVRRLVFCLLAFAAYVCPIRGEVPGGRSFLAFPEVREHPILWFRPVPQEKIDAALSGKAFCLTAQPGEYFTYQLGVFSETKNIDDVRIEFSPLKSESGRSIPAEKTTCFNRGGNDIHGKPFTKTIFVRKGRVQALWNGIDLENVERGVYTGSATVFVGEETQTVPLELTVDGEPVDDHGYNEGHRLARLHWLDSTLGIDREITKGYVPVERKDNAIRILGRVLRIAPSGLPESIGSYFTKGNTAVHDKESPLLAEPFRFVIELEHGEPVELVPGELRFTEQTPSSIAWTVTSTSEYGELVCDGRMEFDGFVDYRLTLTAKKALRVDDIRIEYAVTPEKAEYMMGLNHEGGLRNRSWEPWRWNVEKHQDALWLGNVDGGLRVKWKAENYVRPLVNIYYKDFGRLNLPPSWGNDQKGGVDVIDREKDVLVRAYSANRALSEGESLHFDMEMLITPVKLLDRDLKFGDRYYHRKSSREQKLKTAVEIGANVINIHQAEEIYPFINYPLLDDYVPEIKEFVDACHAKNIRLKLYYTTRELTKNLPEFFALNSLDGEIIYPGPGNDARTGMHRDGPPPWLAENVRERYIPAWKDKINAGKKKGETDLSVITTPDGRMNNFYIAGLDWMLRNLKIDGVYIDDSALDRFTLRRARKLIDRHCEAGRIDLHSWNHFNGRAGMTHCLHLYMDLLPYLDLVWIGEGRNYDRLPDHWLIEVSGIPFGLTGQMLHGGGNPWRGMVYGITNRAGWTGASPEPLWKFFDEYNFAQRDLVGYWESEVPATCEPPLVKVSVFKGEHDAVLVAANWSDEDQTVSIGLDPAKWKRKAGDFKASIPEIKSFQTEQKDVSLDNLTVPARRGFLIVLTMGD